VRGCKGLSAEVKKGWRIKYPTRKPSAPQKIRTFFKQEVTVSAIEPGRRTEYQQKVVNGKEMKKEGQKYIDGRMDRVLCALL
jgi:hypothetical protein